MTWDATLDMVGAVSNNGDGVFGGVVLGGRRTYRDIITAGLFWGNHVAKTTLIITCEQEERGDFGLRSKA